MPSNVSGDPYFGLSRAGRRRLRAEYSRRYEQRLTERDGFLRSRLEPGEVILAASAAHGFVTDRRILSAHQLRQPPRAGAWVCESLGYAQIRGWMVGSQHDGRPLIRLMHEPVLRPQHLPAHRFLWFEWGDAEGEAPHTTTLLAFNRVSYPVFVALREALEGASIPQGEPFAFRPEGTRQERMGMGGIPTYGRARFECRSLIDAPIERVFDLALSIDAHAGSMIRHEERAIGGITSGQMGLGEEVTWRARHFGVRWTMTNRIVGLERPTFFIDEQVRGPFARFRHEHRFTSVEGGTEMLDAVSFAAPYGPIGILAERILRPYLRRLIELRNGHLKEMAEHGA